MKCGKPYRKKTPIVTKSNNKDNAPPSNPDRQDVPHSLKEFMKLKRLASVESTDTKKKKQRSNIKNEKSSSNLPPTSKVVSRCLTSKPVVDAVKEEKIQAFKKKKHKKYQKLKEKRKLKKLQQKEKITIDVNEDMKDVRKEEIKFGEVVHRPPQISVLPRKVTKTGFENRPGRKDDLLLKSLLQKSNYNKEKTRIPLTDKRKNLSISDQRQIEIERQKAVLAYKNMKQKQSRIKNLNK